jgi:hypothetical protein
MQRGVQTAFDDLKVGDYIISYHRATKEIVKGVITHKEVIQGHRVAFLDTCQCAWEQDKIFRIEDIEKRIENSFPILNPSFIRNFILNNSSYTLDSSSITTPSLSSLESLSEMCSELNYLLRALRVAYNGR